VLVVCVFVQNWLKRRIDMAEEKEKAIDNNQATKIPAGAPKDKQLSDEDLEKVAGGAGGGQEDYSRRSATGGGGGRKPVDWGDS
jgi:hypothetical protein